MKTRIKVKIDQQEVSVQAPDSGGIPLQTYRSTVQRRVLAKFSPRKGLRENIQFTTTIPARLAQKVRMRKGEMLEWVHVDDTLFTVTRVPVKEMTAGGRRVKRVRRHPRRSV